MDIEGLENLLRGLECGAIRIITRDLTEPSPLALEVLSARPYAFLDDAPLEERRTQAVVGRRWLDPERASDIGQLDAEAIARHPLNKRLSNAAVRRVVSECSGFGT